MLRHKLSQSDLFLIVANLLPVYGVWFLGWEAIEAFVIYCLETIIIGFFTLVKMGVTTAYKKVDWWHNKGAKQQVHGIVFMLFFIAHYGMFVTIQMVIFFKSGNVLKETDSTILNYLLNLQDHLSSNAWIVLSGFVIGYGYKMVNEFLLTDEYKTKSLMTIMFEPYIRVFVQQFTVILGSMFLVFGAGKIFVLIFSAIKIYFTVFINYEIMLKGVLAKAKEESLHQQSNNSHS